MVPGGGRSLDSRQCSGRECYSVQVGQLEVERTLLVRKLHLCAICTCAAIRAIPVQHASEHINFCKGCHVSCGVDYNFRCKQNLSLSFLHTVNLSFLMYLFILFVCLFMRANAQHLQNLNNNSALT